MASLSQLLGSTATNVEATEVRTIATTTGRKQNVRQTITAPFRPKSTSLSAVMNTIITREIVLFICIVMVQASPS